ncbi:MAG: hypothetical protein ACJ8F7_08845 [Gemmataceae bacterium]
MSHDPIAPPPIPFTDAEKAELRTDDVKAAKTIGMLTTGIFLMGGVIYTVVLIWTLLSPASYAFSR